ncbi:helix-hairpin-helix domain-containing protein [Streptomyces mobaraensis]|nr:MULTISPECIES: ComEA family DNA-binding protein [Streptomyces]UBI38888.1 helix-hairpin-helix domain-containing protein [Streptomyces mobaraensis]UKW31467.1 helix-hairpin-helix domain-containing protein [Streptomyces sp. TYQ1024]
MTTTAALDATTPTPDTTLRDRASALMGAAGPKETAAPKESATPKKTAPPPTRDRPPSRPSRRVRGGCRAGAGPGRGTHAGTTERPRAGGPRAGASRPASPAPRTTVGSPEPLPRPTRWRLAFQERLPLWVQLRCGIEPRTLAALAIVLAAAGLFAAFHFWTGRPRTVPAPTRETPVAAPLPSVRARPGAPPPAPVAAVPVPPAGTPGPSTGGVVVDVSGKVRRPGIQRLPAGSRVVDALDAAGGASPGVDMTGLNRARVLADGEQIVVGVPPGAGPPLPNTPARTNDAGPGGGLRPATGTTPATGANGPLSLNAATVEQLDALPGVGPVLAQHIVDYRTQHGGFRSVTDLRQVNGIGARRFADLRPLVQP